MKKLIRSWGAASLIGWIALCAGCSPNDFMRDSISKITPDEDEALAMKIIEHVTAREYDAAESMLSPDLMGPDLRSNMVYVADMLNHAEPIRHEMVGCNIFRTSDVRRSLLTYEYEYPEQWQLVVVRIETRDEEQLVSHFVVHDRDLSLRAEHRFALSGKTLEHYLMLVMVITIPPFILYALVTCVRTKLQKRKWLWILFILFGIGQLGLNWTTGQWLFNPLRLYFQLFGAGFSSSGLYAPWVLTISFPLGAILFLAKRKKLMARTMEESDSAEAPIPQRED